MKNNRWTLTIQVIDIKQNCPVYQIGDTFKIGNGFILETSNPLCMHFLTSLMPYYVPLSRGISPGELGFTRKGENAYVQCLNPCDYTGGGTVIFVVSVEK